MKKDLSDIFKLSEISDLIESMKMCGNCKYLEEDRDNNIECIKVGFIEFPTLNWYCDKWELKEK